MSTPKDGSAGVERRPSGRWHCGFAAALLSGVGCDG